MYEKYSTAGMLIHKYNTRCSILWMLYFCTYKFEYCLYVTNDNMDGHRAQNDV